MSVALWPLRWFYREFGMGSIHQTGRDAYLIILARTLRMFAYGTNNLILAIFFAALDYSDHQIGIFMTLTLLGDVFLATFLTLVAGSMLMIVSGVTFAVFENFWILLLAAVSGVISVTGGDFGPFRSIEESVLSQLTTFSTRSDVLAWYVTSSALGSSFGSEASGRIIHALQSRDGWTAVDAYHSLFWIFAATGVINTLLVLALSSSCELQPSQAEYAPVAQSEQRAPDIEATTQPPNSPPKKGARSWLVSHFSQISAPTRSIMYKLWFLLAVDSLADGMVPYSLTNYYMDVKFHPAKSTLGDVTSVSYFLAAIGSAFAGPLARKIGLINTMVFTHVPSSAAVLIFPLPNAFWITAVLMFIRAGLNNMDQAPRASFIAAVVKPEERTAAMGITSALRTMAAMAGPMVTGALAAKEQFWIAFVMAGVCRLAYDFGLYALFVNMVLDQNESAPQIDAAPDRTEDVDDMDVELESLTGSDEDPKENDTMPGLSRQSSLQVPTSRDRIRSRSPHFRRS